MSSSWSSIALIVRMVMFGIISAFSLFVLGIDAHIASVLAQNNIVDTANIFSLVIALLTLFTLPAFLAVSIISKGHVLNVIGIELGVMALFWILWMAAGALAITDFNFVFFCAEATNLLNGNNISLNCSEPLAVQAFAWLNWVIITKYIIILLILAIIQHIRGNQVWTKPITNANLFAPRVLVATTVPVYDQRTGAYYTAQQTVPVQVQQTAVYTAQPAQMAYPPAPGVDHTHTHPTHPQNPGYRV